MAKEIKKKTIAIVERKIKIPEKVDITLDGRKISINGPKGSVARDFDDPRFNKKITIEKKDDEIILKGSTDKRKIKAMVGTIWAHINNMITGVTKGFIYTLKIHHVHFPMTIDVKDKQIHIKNFLGEKSTRIAKIVGETKVKVEKDKIMITGLNKEDVGGTASNIETVCKLSKKDRRIFQDGIFITEKGISGD